MRVDKLRKLAELNLCKDCYEKYKMLIEPSFKDILSNPLTGWPETEAYLTSIIWKDVGAYDFGGTSVLVDFDINDHLPEKANKEIMLKIKKWPFSEKLNYLKKRGIIGENTYKLFEKARKARNKIHKLNHVFSEDDLELIRLCGNIAAQIQMYACFKNLEQRRSEVMVGIEEYCKQILIRVEKSKKHNGF